MRWGTAIFDEPTAELTYKRHDAATGVRASYTAEVDVEFVQYTEKDPVKGRGSLFFSTDFYMKSNSIKVAMDAYEGNVSEALGMDIVALEQIASNISNGNTRLLHDMVNATVSAITHGEAARSKVLLVLAGAISAGKSTFFQLFFF